jgi:hypothetical protein
MLFWTILVVTIVYVIAVICYYLRSEMPDIEDEIT